MRKATQSADLFKVGIRKLARGISAGGAVSVFLLTASACYHAVPIGAAASDEETIASVPADSSRGGSGSSKQLKQATRCAAYFLLVENALPRPVEIYEVGHMNDRFVAYAQVGITELPMTESSQQFIAMSRGELMAASSATEHRPGDRVALQRSCRPS